MSVVCRVVHGIPVCLRIAERDRFQAGRGQKGFPICVEGVERRLLSVVQSLKNWNEN